MIYCLWRRIQRRQIIRPCAVGKFRIDWQALGKKIRCKQGEGEWGIAKRRRLNCDHQRVKLYIHGPPKIRVSSSTMPWAFDEFFSFPRKRTNFYDRRRRKNELWMGGKEAMVSCVARRVRSGGGVWIGWWWRKLGNGDAPRFGRCPNDVIEIFRRTKIFAPYCNKKKKLADLWGETIARRTGQWGSMFCYFLYLSSLFYNNFSTIVV